LKEFDLGTDRLVGWLDWKENRSKKDVKTPMNTVLQRRPVKGRTAPWAQMAAVFLVRAGLTPNQVSLASIGFATLGALCYGLSASTNNISRSLCLVTAAACAALRLLCNLLDGLMAVEHGMSTKTGEIYNEFTDRISDFLFFLLAGYAAKNGQLGLFLGWSAASLALLSAYIRAFGARFCQKQDFGGPMAKPQRMWFLCAGSIIAAFESTVFGTVFSLTATLVVICAGTLCTCFARTARLCQIMENSKC